MSFRIYAKNIVTKGGALRNITHDQPDRGLHTSISNITETTSLKAYDMTIILNDTISSTYSNIKLSTNETPVILGVKFTKKDNYPDPEPELRVYRTDEAGIKEIVLLNPTKFSELEKGIIMFGTGSDLGSSANPYENYYQELTVGDLQYVYISITSSYSSNGQTVDLSSSVTGTLKLTVTTMSI